MNEQFTGLRAIREAIIPGPRAGQEEATRKEEEIDDLKLCLAGNPASKRWKTIKIELTNKEQNLLHLKRRLAGRTPEMESWADPLP